MRRSLVLSTALVGLLLAGRGAMYLSADVQKVPVSIVQRVPEPDDDVAITAPPRETAAAPDELVAMMPDDVTVTSVQRQADAMTARAAMRRTLRLGHAAAPVQWDDVPVMRDRSDEAGEGDVKQGTFLRRLYALLGTPDDGQVLTAKDGELVWRDLPSVATNRTSGTAIARPIAPGAESYTPPRGGGGSPGAATAYLRDGNVESHDHTSGERGGTLDINAATTGILAQGRGGLGYASYETGALLVGNNGSLEKRSIGSDGDLLTVSGSTVGWKSLSTVVQGPGDARYVNASGDTMTGTLTILHNGLGINVTGVASGAVLHASSALRSSGSLTVDGTSYFKGNVGIGTASPAAPLHIQKDHNGETAVVVLNATDGTAAQVGFVAGSDSSHQVLLQYMAPSHSLTAWANKGVVAATSQTDGLMLTSYGAGGSISLQTGGVDASNVRMLINSAGNVGIGKTSPSTKLDVAGTISGSALVINGTQTFNGAATITSTAAATVGLTVKGASSQTANLQEWQSAAGSVLASISSAGVFTTQGITMGGNINAATHSVLAQYFQDSSATKGYWQTSASGINWLNINRVPTNVNVALRAVAGQTANLQEWQDSAGSVKARVNSNGQGAFNGVFVNAPGIYGGGTTLSFDSVGLMVNTRITAGGGVYGNTTYGASQNNLTIHGSITALGVGGASDSFVVNSSSALTTGKLAVFKDNGTQRAYIDASGQVNASNDGLVTKVVAGACDDSAFTTDTDGTICIDSSNGRLYFRYGSAWHYAAQTAGFQIPNIERNGKLETEGLAIGDAVIGRIDERMADGALHAVWEKLDLEQSILRTLQENPEAWQTLAGGIAAGSATGSSLQTATAGLECDASSGKLLWDAAAQRFSCGVDRIADAQTTAGGSDADALRSLGERLDILQSDQSGAILQLERRIAALESRTGALAANHSVPVPGLERLTASGTVALQYVTVEETVSVGGDARIGGDLHLEGALITDSLFIPGTAIIDGDLTIHGKLRFSTDSALELADLIVEDTLFVMGDVTIHGLATFLGDVTVKGELVVSTKQAGYASVPAGAGSVTVLFASGGFSNQPVVTVSPNSRVGAEWWTDPATKTGFTIRLDAPASQTVTFSWLALATENAHLAVASVPVSDRITFPIDPLGYPLSSNDIWNACIRNRVTLDASGQPYSCSRYHVDRVWEHPDLGISFTFNASLTPPYIELPEGYEAVMTDEPASAQPAGEAGSSSASSDAAST